MNIELVDAIDPGLCPGFVGIKFALISSLFSCE